MLNILLTAILLANVTILVMFFVFLRQMQKAKAEVNEVYDEFKTFISQADPDTPSPLAQTVSSISDMIARSLVAQVKTTFMGIESGVSRAENSIQQNAFAQANPLIAGLVNMFPKTVKRTLIKHPELIDMALSKFGGNKTNGEIIPTSTSSSTGNQGNFNLG